MTMPAPTHTRPDHDETLIARHAAGDLDASEIADARAQIAGCQACATLDADVRSIIAASAGLPAPRRTRDFQLTTADAARLRRRGWRRILGRFGDPRLALTRPLATGLVTLGIAGLVVASAPSFFASSAANSAPTSVSAQAPGAPAAGGAGSATDQFTSGSPGSPYGPYDSGRINPTTSAPAGPVSAPSAAASTAPAASQAPASVLPPDTTAAPAPIASTGGGIGLGLPSPGTTAAPEFNSNPGIGKSADTSGGNGPAGPSPLVLASIVLIAVGAGLFVIRWAGRRLA